jgi:AraC-like DNA-binding protein
VAGGRVHELRREARLERVRQGICETIAPFDLRVDADQDCLVEVGSVDLGLVRLVYASGDRIDAEVVRTPRLIRRSDPDLCKIDLQLSGRAVVEQDDRQADLRAGAFTFVDLSRPCQLVGGLDGVVAVMFPRSLLPLRHRDTRNLAGVTFQPQDANSALVTALIGHVIRRPDDYTATGGDRIGAAILEVVTAALAIRLDRYASVAPETRQHALTWRVKTYIEQRLADPGLSPARIAAAHHVSLRYLYRLFEAEHATIGSWIRTRRLDRCRRDLADPCQHGRAVSAIGARWGFADATHFARAFKAEYGLTPSEYRRICARSV